MSSPNHPDTEQLDRLLQHHYRQHGQGNPPSESLLFAIIDRLPATAPRAGLRLSVAHVLVLALVLSTCAGIGILSRSILDLHQAFLASLALIIPGLALFVGARWVCQGESIVYHRMLRRSIMVDPGDVLVYRVAGLVAVIAGAIILH